jgi:hypothetical protein
MEERNEKQRNTDIINTLYVYFNVFDKLSDSQTNSYKN